MGDVVELDPEKDAESVNRTYLNNGSKDDPGITMCDQDRPPLLRWNESRATTIKSLATFYSLFLLGLNDAVYGVSHQERGC